MMTFNPFLKSEAVYINVILLPLSSPSLPLKKRGNAIPSLLQGEEGKD
jgi:hypothetical protein